MTITGLYCGSFDPLTNGHIDIIKRSLSFCDNLVIAVGVNPNKKNMFDEEERLSFIRSSFAHFANIKATSFQGLLVDYAKQINAKVLIRGIRSVSDFEYEINLANINKILAPEIETVFLPTSPDLAVVSSSMVKEIAKLGGDIKRFVPIHVAEAVLNKISPGFVKHGVDKCPLCGKTDTLKFIESFQYCCNCGIIV